MSTAPKKHCPRATRASRSVTGCLTCRDRRVKCVVSTHTVSRSATSAGSTTTATAACDNCRRLRLPCTSSLGLNFKTWTPATPATTTTPSVYDSGGRISRPNRASWRGQSPGQSASASPRSLPETAASQPAAQTSAPIPTPALPPAPLSPPIPLSASPVLADWWYSFKDDGSSRDPGIKLDTTPGQDRLLTLLSSAASPSLPSTTTPWDGFTILPSLPLHVPSSWEGSRQGQSGNHLPLASLTDVAAAHLYVEDQVADFAGVAAADVTFAPMAPLPTFSDSDNVLFDSLAVPNFLTDTPLGPAPLTFFTPTPATVSSMASDTNSGVYWLATATNNTSASNNNHNCDDSSIPPPMPLVYGNSHGGMPLLNGIEAWVPALLTLKTSTWNAYHLMVDSTVGQPTSPLRYAVLGWTCAYLSLYDPAYRPSQPGALAADAVYYAAASAAVQSLSIEISRTLADGGRNEEHGRRGAAAIANQDPFSSPTSSHASSPSPLYLLLATSFFLCIRDIMVSDYAPFRSRVALLRSLFAQHKHQLLRKCCGRCGRLSALEGRLVLWLAYMDVWASVFHTNSVPASATSTDADMTPRLRSGHQNAALAGQPTNLLDLLIQIDALAPLRNLPADTAAATTSTSTASISTAIGTGAIQSHSYLSVSFGANYPAAELAEDLALEPCHRLCDDVLAVLSGLNAFEQWDDAQQAETTKATAPLVAELRVAKLQALRADLARIKAECAMLWSHDMDEGCEGDSSSDSDYARGENGNNPLSTPSRTAFHALNVTALRLAVTILLSRVAEPYIRTETAAQASARALVRIAQRLRQSRTLTLRRPRWLLWPLPLFVAGIEIEDPVYREWLLDYLAELAPNDGTARMARVRALLVRVVAQQAATGRRVRVREILEGFDGGLIV